MTPFVQLEARRGVMASGDAQIPAGKFLLASPDTLAHQGMHLKGHSVMHHHWQTHLIKKILPVLEQLTLIRQQSNLEAPGGWIQANPT